MQPPVYSIASPLSIGFPNVGNNYKKGELLDE